MELLACKKIMHESVRIWEDRLSHSCTINSAIHSKTHQQFASALRASQIHNRAFAKPVTGSRIEAKPSSCSAPVSRVACAHPPKANAHRFRTCRTCDRGSLGKKTRSCTAASKVGEKTIGTRRDRQLHHQRTSKCLWCR